MKSSIDILMITYNRAEYTRLALARLLDTCDENMRVWVWHNGNHEETLEIVKAMQDHPNFYKFYHSIENKKLNIPTNWLWSESEGDFLCKVDDDCLMPYGWADTLRKAHADFPEFGVIGCWRYPDEDFVPELANKKIKTFTGGHQLLLNCWVEGSGYLMKRACLNDLGLLGGKATFTEYCIRLALKKWVVGWYYPFLYQEHMDDPRAEHSQIKTEEHFDKFKPLTAINFHVNSIEDWIEWIRQDAIVSQSANIDPKYWMGWRPKLRRLFNRLLRRT